MSNAAKAEFFQRSRLIDELPLDTPFSIEYFPVGKCNLRCSYCAYTSKEEAYMSQMGRYMEMALFKKSIDDLAGFKQKVRSIHFCGLGEPTMHPELAPMIDYTLQSGRAKKVDLLTNGTLFTRKAADAVLDTGLDWIRISLNGLSKQDYVDYTGAAIDFDKMVDRLSYLHQRRGDTKIYIKILDYMVDSDEKRARFFEIFEPISDVANVEGYENVVPDAQLRVSGSGITMKGQPKSEVKVCSMPYFKMYIHPDGSVKPCCEYRFNLDLGNVNDASVPEAWLGERFNRFRRQMLNGASNCGRLCAECTIRNHSFVEEDRLDDHVEQLNGVY